MAQHNQSCAEMGGMATRDVLAKISWYGAILVSCLRLSHACVSTSSNRSTCSTAVFSTNEQNDSKWWMSYIFHPL